MAIEFFDGSEVAPIPDVMSIPADLEGVSLVHYWHRPSRWEDILAPAP